MKQETKVRILVPLTVAALGLALAAVITERVLLAWSSLVPAAAAVVVSYWRE